MKTRSALYIAWHYYPLNLWPVRKVSVWINTRHAFHLGRCTITWLHYEWPTWCALRYIKSSTHADIISRAACIRWPQWTLPLPTLCNAAIVSLSPSRQKVSESVCRKQNRCISGSNRAVTWTDISVFFFYQSVIVKCIVRVPVLTWSSQNHKMARCE